MLGRLLHDLWKEITATSPGAILQGNKINLLGLCSQSALHRKDGQLQMEKHPFLQKKNQILDLYMCLFVSIGIILIVKLNCWTYKWTYK